MIYLHFLVDQHPPKIFSYDLPFVVPLGLVDDIHWNWGTLAESGCWCSCLLLFSLPFLLLAWSAVFLDPVVAASSGGSAVRPSSFCMRGSSPSCCSFASACPAFLLCVLLSWLSSPFLVFLVLLVCFFFLLLVLAAVFFVAQLCVFCLPFLFACSACCGSFPSSDSSDFHFLCLISSFM